MALISTRTLGLTLAATGVAHFVAPEAFEGVTRTAFPNDTAKWVQRNGATETALGVALTLKGTRKLGVLGLLGYVGWLGFNAANAGK